MRREIANGALVPFIGVYDVFSASLAARHFDALFLSGFSFAASYYGLPDIGFITWTDILNFVQRIRNVLPAPHLLVDIDDGYCDTEVACHVTATLEKLGASGVVLEDQKRPRRCGHFDGKLIMELDEYLAKLKAVVATKRDLFVVARTDASDPADIERRVLAFADAGADAVLVDGVRNLDSVKELSKRIRVPFCFNQIAGGKSPPCTLTELHDVGARLVIYSTPCLFSAQAAIDKTLTDLKAADGSLAGSVIGVKGCTEVLTDNMKRALDVS
jgi:2-methylisocitrate lyase-like PEP mutase family enzyme